MTTAEKARLAFNNDQFLAGDLDDPSHGGTFRGSWSNTAEIDAQKAWLTTFSATHQFRAETDWPKDGTYGQYARAHVDDDGFARYHASTWRDIRGLQSTFSATKVAEIKRRLGYRLVLKQAILPTSVQRGQVVAASFYVENEGYARPSHSRPVYLVFNGVPALLNRPSGALDAREWFSGSNTAFASVTVPSDATSGPLSLWLPDKDPRLTDPRYSIRLANLNTWDATTGRNRLNANVTVQ